MTSPRRPGRPLRSLTSVGAWLLALLAAVGLLVLSAGTASAATPPDGQTRVRASTPETITAVGVSEHIAAGQGRGPPLSQPRFVVATGVAAETAGSAADHVVLGKSIGLPEQAAKIGGRHLMNDSAWQDSVLKAIGDPNTRISVVLDGAEGSSTYARVANAALRGSQGKGTPFDWEMAQLMQSGRLPSVSFYEGGASVANPFG